MSIIYSIKTVDQIVDAARRYIISLGNGVLTNWNLGSRLWTLTTGFARIVSDAMSDMYVSVLNLIPTSIYEGLGFGILPGTYASGFVNFTRLTAADQDYTILAGTTFVVNGIYYKTTADAVLLTGQTSIGDVPAQCMTIGSAGNLAQGAINSATGKGYFQQKPLGVDNIDNTSSMNSSAFSNGTDSESDQDRITRFTSYVQGLTKTNLAGQITSAYEVTGDVATMIAGTFVPVISPVPTVVAANVQEQYPQAGTNTVYVDDGGGVANTDLIRMVQKWFDGDPENPNDIPGRKAAGLNVVVQGPEKILLGTSAIVLAVKVPTNEITSDSTIISAVKNALLAMVNGQKMGNDVTIGLVISTAMGSYTNIFDALITNGYSGTSANAYTVIRAAIDSFDVSVVRTAR